VTTNDKGTTTRKVGFIGLGAMGTGMALRLVGAGLTVAGYDVRADAAQALGRAGGRAAASPADAARDADALVVMVVNADQTDAVLFGKDGAVETLPKGALVMVSTTVPASYIRGLATRLAEHGYQLLDAPVSGGTVGAESGKLTIMAAGTPEAFARAEPILAATAGKVYRLGDAPGMGSAVKTVNQLLAGVHIAAAAEAMALGAKAGIDPRVLFEVISNSAGMSWMFNNRVPHMLDGDYTPKSAVEIFVKDLGLVLDTGHELRFPLPLSASAHQLFLAASASGHGREDDSAVVKVFEQLTGCRVSRPK